MNEPLLHPKTKLALGKHLQNPSQSILLVGDEGIGKYFVALWITDQLQIDQITVAVPEDKQMIGIEQIQQLYKQTRTGKPLCFIVEDAHLMTGDAQNAFLKLLEEPPQQTYFILTAKNEDSILQTIRSRCQIYRITPTDPETTLVYIEQAVTTDLNQIEITTLIKTTGGKAGELLDMLTNPESVASHRALIDEVKQFYIATPYQRLQSLTTHSFEQEWIQSLLNILVIIVESLITNSSGDRIRIATLQKQSQVIEETAKALSNAGNQKIHLSRLAVRL